MNELGGNKGLKVLVHDLCGRDHHSGREAVLNVEQQVTSQERFARVFLADNDNHRTFARIHSASVFDHVHVELPELKIHLVLTVVYFLTFITETLHNGKGLENDVREHEDPPSTETGRNALVYEDNAALFPLP
jgi:hypothetical protein